MNLLIEVDASAENLMDTFTLSRGDAVNFVNSANLSGPHGPPPVVTANVLEGAEHAEVIGSFRHGVVVDSQLHPAKAVATIPAPESVLLRTLSPGKIVVEVVAAFGFRTETATFNLTVVEPAPSPAYEPDVILPA